MSRKSSDEYGLDGQLVNGFDYDLQVWVINRIIQRCGHPMSMKDCCDAPKFAGMTVIEARKYHAKEVA